jgi:hypothetical protein
MCRSSPPIQPIPDRRFDVVMRKLLTFFAGSRAFDPFFGRRLPSMVAAAGFADSRCEAIACHRQGGSVAAQLLCRSLEPVREAALRRGVVDADKYEALLAAMLDLSFGFVDALSVAAWGRDSGLLPSGNVPGTVPFELPGVTHLPHAQTPPPWPTG